MNVEDWGIVLLSLVLAALAFALMHMPQPPPAHPRYGTWGGDDGIPMTAPPFQRSQPLEKSADAARPDDYGQPALSFHVKAGDKPWTGNEDARNLQGGRNQPLHAPMLSYSFPRAGYNKHIPEVKSLKSASLAGMHELGAFSRTSADPTGLNYKDLVTTESLGGMRNPVQANPYMRG